MAQAPPDLTVEMMTPAHDKCNHLLGLSTSLDTVDLALHTPPSMLRAEVGPSRYYYRNARRVKRKYNWFKRYYRYLNRHHTRQAQKQSYRK